MAFEARAGREVGPLRPGGVMGSADGSEKVQISGVGWNYRPSRWAGRYCPQTAPQRLPKEPISTKPLVEVAGIEGIEPP